MSLVYAIACTGSCGNCNVLYDGQDSIVLDFGISARRFVAFMEENSIPLDSVRGIFLTHLHPDHASKSLRVFQKKHPVVAHLSSFAAKREHRAFVSLDLDSELTRLFKIGEKMTAGNFTIEAIEAFHDSQGCVSYIVSSGLEKAALITDTGYFSDEMVERARNCDLLLLEADYDDALLDESEYSLELKSRIRSELGHLSNEQAKRFLLRLGERKSREVVLVHLSGNNNSPDRALACVSEASSLCNSIRAVEHGGSMIGEIGLP